MFKFVAAFCLILIGLLSISLADASSVKKKKKTHSRKSRIHKKKNHSKKSRYFNHGTGPDLKSITTDSPYEEDPSNGVNPIETKQPEMKKEL